MLALCLMLSKTYYAQNYAGIIGLGLVLNGIGGLCYKVSLCYNYSMAHDVTSLVAS